MYPRSSRTPPKDSVPKAGLTPIISQEKQQDDVPSPYETQSEPGEAGNIEDHSDTEGEEFHEGDLYCAEAEVEKVMQSPLVAYAESLVTNEEVEPLPRGVEADRIPSPKHEEEHIREEMSNNETPKQQNLGEEMEGDQQEETW